MTAANAPLGDDAIPLAEAARLLGLSRNQTWRLMVAHIPYRFVRRSRIVVRRADVLTLVPRVPGRPRGWLRARPDTTAIPDTALALMPAQIAAVVRLRDTERWTFVAISVQLGIPADAVAAAYHQVKRRAVEGGREDAEAW